MFEIGDVLKFNSDSYNYYVGIVVGVKKLYFRVVEYYFKSTESCDYRYIDISYVHKVTNLKAIHKMKLCASGNSLKYVFYDKIIIC